MDPRTTDTTDVMTTDQMARLLRDELGAVETAGEAHAREEARWHRTGLRTDVGGPRGEGRAAIIAAERAAHQPEREAAAAAAATAARAADANARAVLRQLGPERAALPAAMRGAAAELAPLIEADAARLPLPQLAQEFRAAVTSNDAPAMWVWSRAVAPRIAARPAGVEHPNDAAARAELQRLTSQVKDRLRDSSLDGIRAQADRVLERAGAVRAAAAKGRRAVAGPVTTAGGAVKVPWPDQAAR